MLHMAFFIKQKYCVQQHAFLYPHKEESTIHQPQAGPPFSPERSSLMCLPILVHKLAVELKGKLQDGIPVSALYVKNAKDN